ncbi:MAG TPA: TetR/AcrR family transcriptional regulator [Candidatus Acidoferrum sp.]|nr:TetR/AcrR family transcriptional regulator [Candidatus Acidoferrum sp.]
MSGKAPASAGKTDRRVVRTRDLLGDALVALMHDKAFESITVQDVLDRAGVGRSTFYTHYKDKNDLFLSDAEEFFEAMSTALSKYGDKSNRVAPVCEFFSHVAEQREFHDALVASGKIQDLWEMGQEYFARGIEQRFKELRGVPALAAERASALAHAFAGALFSLLSWWIQSGPPLSATQMDELFHGMVWSSIGMPAARTSERPKVVRRFVEI